MLEQGLKKREILKILEKKLRSDYSYDSYSILGSMCTKPLDIGIEIYEKYVSKNLGDPGLFLGTAALEKELVSEIGKLFGGSNILGTFTTGGSEANLIALRIAKKLKPNIRHPEIILPISAHVSFDKAADMLGIKLRKVNLKERYKFDLNHFESLINRNTCGVVGIAGTTALGLVDPIEKISKIIDEKNLYFHVDAAFGGFTLPFLKLLNYRIPAWNFSVKNVNSITADPHKMGLGLIPTGGFFLKDLSILEDVGYEIPYLAGGNFKHFNITGTRSGGSVIAFWAIIKSLGLDGFKKIMYNCMENTKYLSKQISEIKGTKLVTKPIMNIVGITTENGESVGRLDGELRKRNWMLGKFENFNLIRVVVMPHVKRAHLEKFCEDLAWIAKDLKLHLN